MDNRRKLLAQAGAVGGPLLLLLGARVVMAPPAPVNAQSALRHVEPSPPASPPPLTKQQEAAARWIQSLELDSSLRSPFSTLRPSGSAAPIIPETAPNSGSVTAGLQLRSVMGRGAVSIASINGRIYKMNDQVRPGLRLHSIDLQAQSVELLGADGTVHVLKCDR
jgi:hypothetical protein